MSMASVGYSSLEDRFQPSAKLLNKTANSGFSYLNPKPGRQQQLQRLPAARSGANNSLPRQRPTGNTPNNLSHARRKLVNSAIQDYLKSLNAMTRSIVLETETVEKENECNWTKLDSARKEDIVNDHFMPAGVRMQYEQERATSCCSFSSGCSVEAESLLCQNQRLPPPQSSSANGEGLVVENRPLHLSQPNDWEEWSRNHHGKQLSRSSDLVYSNEWSSTASNREDLSLSQPSPHQQDMGEPAQQTNFNRLHKKQLSFRPSHKQHAVKQQQQQQQLPQAKYNSFRTQLGSDGESPRTSDEDYEVAAAAQPQNPLGFQRSKLRSYSMRSRKGGAGGGTSIRNSANLRSSFRTSNRVRTHGNENDTKNNDSYNQHCRPSHYHTYSTTSTETDFDEAIDMPDDALLLDHVSRKSSTETDLDDEYVSSKATPKYSRARRSFRNTPKINHESSEVHINRSLCNDATESSTSISSSSDAFLLPPDLSSRDCPILYRPSSRESLDDMDSVSMAPSDLSKYPMDDEESVTDHSRMMTPDSILSTSSSFLCRPRSKTSEIAVLRNRVGKRGGSHIRVATSDFADRHTQFKSNMLQKHQLDSYQASAATTRATSPSSSISSPTHFPTHHDEQDDSRFLKVPSSFGYTSSKHNFVAEGATSDIPCSPDHLSMLSSPPSTPLHLANGYAAPHSHLLRRTLSSTNQEHRESGYVSSSSESFARR